MARACDLCRVPARGRDTRRAPQRSENAPRSTSRARHQLKVRPGVPPALPRTRAADTHRHGSIFLPPAPWWGSGVINSLEGCETRQPGWDPVVPVREGCTDRGDLPLVRATTQPKPTPPPRPPRT